MLIAEDRGYICEHQRKRAILGKHYDIGYESVRLTALAVIPCGIDETFELTLILIGAVLNRDNMNDIRA